MLKIRIYAAIIAISITLFTAYLAPKLYFGYVHWVSGLNPAEKQWHSGVQIFLGFLVAVIGYWRWRMRKKATTEKLQKSEK